MSEGMSEGINGEGMNAGMNAGKSEGMSEGMNGEGINAGMSEGMSEINVRNTKMFILTRPPSTSSGGTNKHSQNNSLLKYLKRFSF